MGNSYERLREVVEKLHDLLMLHGDGKTHCILSWDEFNEAVKMCRSALSIPPRQCDVGTAKEQEDRFEKFCDAHRYVGDDGTNVCSCDCPCYDGMDCGIMWAQMP
jgi:hypothetical protein